jgi:hypothetical protein
LQTFRSLPQLSGRDKQRQRAERHWRQPARDWCRFSQGPAQEVSRNRDGPRRRGSLPTMGEGATPTARRVISPSPRGPSPRGRGADFASDHRDFFHPSPFGRGAGGEEDLLLRGTRHRTAATGHHLLEPQSYIPISGHLFTAARAPAAGSPARSPARTGRAGSSTGPGSRPTALQASPWSWRCRL